MYNLRRINLLHGQFYDLLSNIFVQNLSTRVHKNPGINLRTKLLEIKPEQFDDDLDIDDFESDFMDVHKTHREHVRELEDRKESLPYHIVKTKYFKEVYPNFLTWQEKQQIIFLHNQDPEEWTLEKLSESFPALPKVINKIIKAKWTPNNESRVRNHDKTVQTNWKDFKKGKLNHLPENLKNHLQKFTNRKLNVNTSYEKLIPESKIIDLNKSKVKGEFSQIIESYEQIKNSDNLGINQNESREIPEESDNIDRKKKPLIRRNQLLTLSEIENRLINARECRLQVDEKLMLQTIKDTNRENRSETPVISVENIDDLNSGALQKYESSNKKGVVEISRKDESHLIYPEHIKIPKKLYKKDSLYKLNDCYYDSDGEFLYRVPGMY